MGVWIETDSTTNTGVSGVRSLPAWECGLKLDELEKLEKRFESLPAWECGLKLASGQIFSTKIVSLPAWECGLKQELRFPLIALRLSLPAWECGLKLDELEKLEKRFGHSPRGSVD